MELAQKEELQKKLLGKIRKVVDPKTKEVVVGVFYIQIASLYLNQSHSCNYGLNLYSIDGNIHSYKMEYLNTCKVTATKSISAEVREMLIDLFKLHQELLNIEIEKRKIDNQSTITYEKCKAKQLEIRKSGGILTKSEFCDEILLHLSPVLKRCMENPIQGMYKSSYELAYSPVYGSYKSDYSALYISTDKQIDKYVQEGKYSFIDFIYDQSIHLCEDAEKKADYQHLINKYEDNLPINMKYCSCEKELFLGDKYSIKYVETYTIPIDNKAVLTKAYAVEIAKKMGV